MIVTAKHSQQHDNQTWRPPGSLSQLLFTTDLCRKNQLNGEQGAEGTKTQRKHAGGAEGTEEQGKTSACKNNRVIHLLLSIILHFWVHFKVSFLYDSSHV